MSEDATEKKEGEAENKNQTREVKKDLAVSFKVKPTNLKRKLQLFGEFLFWALISVSGLVLVLALSVGVIGIFPDFVPISSANDLLNILISADGILLGFVGIIYAQLLSSLMDQQNALYERILDKPTEATEKKKFLDFIDFRKRLLSLAIIAAVISLIWSVIVSMANIAKNSKFQPTDTYSTAAFLFGPLLFSMIGVILLILTLAVLPLRPPFEETPKEDQ